MKVLVACEFSGIVRDAFMRHGHTAVSCDLIDTESPGPHIIGDAVEVAKSDNWDLMIAHPPCTHLAVSGAWAQGEKKELRRQALEFVKQLLFMEHIPRIALENPISIISTRLCPPNQIIQPWMFGHDETKATCLWLKNLPKLKPTSIVEGRKPAILNVSRTKHRAIDRSRTYTGIAEAMASQWSTLKSS